MASSAKYRKNFQQFLVLNFFMDFEIIPNKLSLGDPQPNLLKSFHSIEQDGHQS